MNVVVLLFAQARQIAAAEKIEVEIADDAAVVDLKQAIGQLYPDLVGLLSRSNIAIDQQYAIDSDVIPADAEIAMIPPVSGG